MQYCAKCGLNIRGHKVSCPLCGGALTGEATPAVFPVLPQPKVNRFSLFKVAAFLTVLILVAMTVTAYFTSFRYHFPQVVSFAALIALLDLAVALYFRFNPLRMLQTQVYFGMIVLLVIDRLTSFHGWSLIWAIPALFLALMIAEVVIGRTLRGALTDYIIYPFVNTLLSFLQLIGVANTHNPFPYPAVICVSILAVWSAFLIIFRFRELKSAFARYLHV